MRPTPRLLSLLAGCALLAVAGAGASALHLPAWGALGLVLVATLWDALRLRREAAPTLVRTLPPRVRLGEAFEVRYRLENPAPRARRIELLDTRCAAVGGDLAIPTAELGPDAARETTRRWIATRRGVVTLGPVYALCDSALGLLQRRLALTAGDESLRVLPNPGTDAGALRGLAADVGTRPRRRRGEGMEVDSLRPFADGDDPRHVDWRATARAGRLITRTYRDERNHGLVIAVDTGRMMAARVGEVTKLDLALNAAVALVQRARAQGDRVGFTAFDAEVRAWVPVGPAQRRMGGVLDATLALQPREIDADFRALSEQLQRSHRKRSLLIILTDFIESADALGMQAHLKRLSRRHVVLLVALRDPILEQLGRPAPDLDEDTLYARLVLQDLATERDVVLRQLSRLGVHTLDLPPERARAAVLSRYLELRASL